jgi:hypothetical protein
MSGNVGTVVWFELYTRDLVRARAFYENLLGWTFQPFDEYQPDKYLLIRTASGATGKGALVHRDATPELTDSGGSAGSADSGGSGGCVLYVEVADLDASLELVTSIGGRRVAGRRAIGDVDGSFALVEDPDRNVLGLWAPV